MAKSSMASRINSGNLPLHIAGVLCPAFYRVAWAAAQAHRPNIADHSDAQIHPLRAEVASHG